MLLWCTQSDKQNKCYARENLLQEHPPKFLYGQSSLEQQNYLLFRVCQLKVLLLPTQLLIIGVMRLHKGYNWIIKPMNKSLNKVKGIEREIIKT